MIVVDSREFEHLIGIFWNLEKNSDVSVSSNMLSRLVVCTYCPCFVERQIFHPICAHELGMR